MTDEPLRICTVMPLPESQREEAHDRAIAEREGNAPSSRVRTLLEPQQLVSVTGRRWRTGRTILVYFMDGPEWARERAFTYIARWGDIVNLNYVRTNDRSASTFRVTFQRGGSWSHLGVNCASVPIDQPTMQLGWLLDMPNNLDEWRRVGVHEGGHGIAFEHEHQHPLRTFELRIQRTLELYRREQGWTDRQIYQNVINVLSESNTNFSAFDPTSIMEYPIPAEILVNPADAVGWNDTRSATDKRYAALWYPKPALQETIDRYVNFLESAAEAKEEGN